MIFFWRHSKEIVSLLLLVGMLIAGMSHFATAAEVEKKFAAVKIEIKVVGLESRRDRIQDELFRLRNDINQKGTAAQIERYESELLDVSARLRQLEERRH